MRIFGIFDRFSGVAVLASLVAFIGNLWVAWQIRNGMILQTYLLLLALFSLVGCIIAYVEITKPPEPAELKDNGVFRGVRVWKEKGDDYVNRKEAGELAEKLTENRLVVLSGKSGQGKSSLLRADVPSMAGKELFSYESFYLDAYLESIDRKIREKYKLGNSPSQDLALSLSQAAERLKEEKKIPLVIFDQFEPLLTRPDQGRENLKTVSQLLCACSDAVKFIIGIREEWYLKLVDFLEASDRSLKFDHVTMGNLSLKDEAMRKRVGELAGKAKFQEMAEEWVRDLEGKEGIVPVEMQITGQVIESNPQVVTKDYYKRSKKEGLIDDYFSILIKKSGDHKEETSLILLALSQERNLRRLVSLEQLQLLVQVEEGTIKAVLTELQKEGVIINEGSHFSLAHDYLAEKYQGYVVKKGNPSTRELMRTMAATWDIVKDLDEETLKQKQVLRADEWRKRGLLSYSVGALLGVFLLGVRMVLPCYEWGRNWGRRVGLNFSQSPWPDLFFLPALVSAFFSALYFLLFYLNFMVPAEAFWERTKFRSNFFNQIPLWPVGVYLVSVMMIGWRSILWPVFGAFGSAVIAASAFGLGWAKNATPAFRQYFRKLGVNLLVGSSIITTAWLPLWMIYKNPSLSLALFKFLSIAKSFASQRCS